DAKAKSAGMYAQSIGDTQDHGEREGPRRRWATAEGRSPADCSRQVEHGGLGVYVEHAAGLHWRVAFKVHIRQPLAGGERVISKAGHADGDRDRGQSAAARERPRPDIGDTLADGNVGQPGAVDERLVPNSSHVVGDGDLAQTAAGSECPNSDAGDTVGNSNT